MGTPEKGSGWGSAKSYSTNSDSWGNPNTDESPSGSGARIITESEGSSGPLLSEQKVSSNAWLSGENSITINQSHQRSGTWTNDSEEEKRSQSPSGLIMITSRDNIGAHQDEFIGISNWGNQETKCMMGNSWKVPSEKDNCTASDWDDAELSFNENSQCLTLSNGNDALSKEQSLSYSELECSSLDRYDPGSYTFSAETSRSETGTPTRSNSRSSGGATPTQETGGRTSAGSTSSVNSIGSSSSWKSDGKGGKTYTNRLGSPRKPSRYIHVQ